MRTGNYFIAAAGFILLTVIFYTLLLRELKQALPKTNIPPQTQNKIFYRVMFSLIAWFTIVSILSLTGVLLDFSSFPPKLFIVLIIPFVSILFITFSTRLKQILHAIPPQNIIRLQTFRVFVEILLWWLFVQNLLPVQMTFDGRNFDIIAGLTAPIIAYLGFTKKILPKSVLIAWNILCLALLINIVIIAILSMPTPFRAFMNEPANTIVAHFPVVLLPAFLVPLAYGLHFFSLRQLLIKRLSVDSNN
jgi:hypothetical protein